MTASVDSTIDALQRTHSELAGVVRTLSDEQLEHGSGASEWTVAQVLSHLGSGAEITAATLRAATAGAPGPEQDFNQAVWDSWNALSPRQQAGGFLTTDSALVASFQELTAAQREGLQVAVGFSPAPLPLAAYLGMRLNEAAQHAWDVRVSVDPGAAIDAGTALLLAEHFATDLSFLLGFTSKPDALAQPSVVEIEGTDFALVIAEKVTVATSAPPRTARLAGPLEAVIRLLSGRLTAGHTPTDVQVTGNITLDDLRRVFPGY